MEFSFDLRWIEWARLQLLLVDREEVSELGTFLDFPDIQDDSHHNILESIVPANGTFVHAHVLWQTEDVVAWELFALFEKLVLVEEQTFTEGVVLILLNHVIECRVRKFEQFGLSLASDIDAHLVLHKDGPMIDRTTFVELLKDEGTALKARVDLYDTVLDKVERVRLL